MSRGPESAIRRFPLVARKLRDCRSQLARRSVYITLRRGEVAVSGEDAHGFRTDTRRNEVRAEVVPERVERPLAELVLALKRFETIQHERARRSVSPVVDDHTRRRQLVAQRFAEISASAGDNGTTRSCPDFGDSTSSPEHA